jgi:hypothetical protein
MENLTEKLNNCKIDNNNDDISAAIKIQALFRGYLLRKKYFLEPCNINKVDFLNIDKFKNRIIKDYVTDLRKEYYDSTTSKNIVLESNIMEYLLAECSNGKRIADGNTSIDIIVNNIGIDITCVCLNKNQTNEKSMIQNFKESGNNLDLLFIEQNDKKILNIFKKSLYHKMKIVTEKYKLTKLYYFVLISNSTNIYLSIFKINLDSIYKIKSNNFTQREKSINVGNAINLNLGSNKIYKSKKRFEIRFSKNIIQNFNTIKIY